MGKAIPYFLIALTDVLVAVFMGQVLFGVVMKSSFWLMVLASAIYISVALCLGLLISIATKSQLVANQAAILITFLPSLLLSNFVFPVGNMPKIFQVLTYVIPATYFIDILNGIYLRSLGLAHLWPSYAVLIGMLIILGNIGFAMLKREGM
jgi:ABC-2 type transport system permease protein